MNSPETFFKNELIYDHAQFDKFNLAISQYSQVNKIGFVYANVAGDSPIFETKLELNGNDVTLQDAIDGLNKENNILLIYGVGGSGKSFMIAQYLKRLQMPISISNCHVLYIPLNELDYSTTQNENIERYISKNVFCNLDWKEKYSNHNSFELILLLDGFNEVPVTERESLSTEIKEYSKNLNSKIVIASRYEDMLAQTLSFGAKASVKELTENVANHYLQQCGISLSLFDRPTLSGLLLNPLMLTLFGNTANFQNDNSYEKKKNLCKWINVNHNDTSDTQVLWNYFNCEILKENDTKQMFLAWISVNVFLPSLAYCMQKKGVFQFAEHDLYEQLNHSLSWIKQNLNSHSELVRILGDAEKHFDFNNLKHYILSLNCGEIFQNIIKKYDQSFFIRQANMYKFIHQSIRDCLAAKHLLNTAPSESALFSHEWSGDDFSKNIYMLHHLAELCYVEGQSVINNSLESLREKTIDEHNLVLRNLFTVFNQPALLGGDFSGFNFSQLDLRFCELTEFTLSKHGEGADFYMSKIGTQTFLRDTHHAPVHCIKISRDGNSIISSGKDKVLLWRFSDRIVEKEMHRYSIKLGDFDDGRNLCCFSVDEACVLFTDASRLMSYDLAENTMVEYLGVENPIVSLSTIKSSEGNAYCVASDKSGVIYVWNENEPQSLKNVITPSDDEWIFYTSMYDQYLRYDKNENRLDLVNSNRSVIRNTSSIQLDNIVACDVSENLFILINERLMTEDEFLNYNHQMKDFLEEYVSREVRTHLYSSMLNEGAEDQLKIHEVFVVDLLKGSTPQSIMTDINVSKVSLSVSGRWFAIIGTRNNQIRADIYQKHLDMQTNYEKKILKQGYTEMQTGIVSSFLLHENLLLYGHKNGTIEVDAVYQNDDERYYYGILNNQPPSVNDMVLVPSSQNLIAGYEDGVLREWNYIKGTCIYRYEKQHTNKIGCVAIANNNALLVSGGDDGKILLWDSENKMFLRELFDISNFADSSSWDIDSKRVRDITFSSDDDRVIFVSGDGNIFVTSIDGDDYSKKTPIILKNDSNFRRPFCYYVSNGEERIVTSSCDREGCIFFYTINHDKNQMELLLCYQVLQLDKIYAIEASSDMKRILVAGDSKFVMEFNAETAQPTEVYLLGKRATNFCFSDENSIYFTTRTKIEENTLIRKLVFEEELTGVALHYSELHAHHKNYHGNFINRVRTDGDAVITCAVDGSIYVSDNKGKELQRMLAYAPISDKLNWCRNITTMAFYPPEFGKQFMAHRIESLVRGDFEEWLRNNFLINIFHLLNLDWNGVLDEPPYDRVFDFCPELRCCTNDFEAIQIIVKSFIACTIPLNLDADGEYVLLTTLISYLHYEHPPSQRNLQTLAKVLIDGLSIHNESNREHYYDFLFRGLREKNSDNLVANYYYDNYRYKFFESTDKIIYSILGGLTVLRPILLNDLPDLRFYDANKFATTLVMNFNIGYELPSKFDNIAVSQRIYIEMLCYYVNRIRDRKDRNKMFVKFLDSGVEKFLQRLKGLLNDCDNKDESQLRELLLDFENRKPNYILLAAANRKISDFYNLYI